MKKKFLFIATVVVAVATQISFASEGRSRAIGKTPTAREAVTRRLQAEGYQAGLLPGSLTKRAGACTLLVVFFVPRRGLETMVLVSVNNECGEVESGLLADEAMSLIDEALTPNLPW